MTIKFIVASFLTSTLVVVVSVKLHESNAKVSHFNCLNNLQIAHINTLRVLQAAVESYNYSSDSYRYSQEAKQAAQSLYDMSIPSSISSGHRYIPQIATVDSTLLRGN